MLIKGNIEGKNILKWLLKSNKNAQQRIKPNKSQTNIKRANNERRKKTHTTYHNTQKNTSKTLKDI